MLTKDEFVMFMLEGPGSVASRPSGAVPETSALPGDFAGHGFDVDGDGSADLSFAQRLMEASGFGDAQHIESTEVILGDNPAARSLPERVYYWPKSGSRQHQTILFELQRAGIDLLEDGLFRDLRREQRVEDALHRLIQHAQQGFAKGGEKRSASVKQGRPDETLVIVSLRDDRSPGEQVNLVCFGTVAAETQSFEAFLISDEPRQWARENRPLAEEHLSRLYFRHFSKLAGGSWQDAFVTGDERKLARKLLDACTQKNRDARLIQEGAVKLVREIAKSFGRGLQAAKLVFDALPPDHFIGADPAAVERPGFRNDFEGMTLRDDRERLLGYVIYCLDKKKDADRLRNLLGEHNSFHNVLVIYPDGDEATLELWQGKRTLVGKMTKSGAQFRGEGDVVNLLSRFFVVSKSTIQSPKELARELAHRAKYLRLIALGELKAEQSAPKGQKRPVLELYKVFDTALARQTEEEFCDAYSQTLTYGLLAARWMARDSGKPFTSENVSALLPSTSPFLSELFQQLIALRIAPRLRWLIEDVVSLLNRTAVNEVFSRDDRDPVIHFYEDFLDAYDASIRAARGVYYTPEPVVRYIVGVIHRVLIERFGLRLGLADTTTWGEYAATRRLALSPRVNPKAPVVQLLDPATGTGTFLKHAIELVYDTMMSEWAGPEWKTNSTAALDHVELWRRYVRESLLPRVHGFELMMAPYIVCHLRLGLLLQEYGFVFQDGDRLEVLLTNSLEPAVAAQGSLLPDFVSKESARANTIKERVLVTAVVMNPPYARHSSNFSDWITGLAGDYKKGFPELNKPAQGKALADDYVKFIRLAQFYIERSGIGCACFIANHGFIENPTFRGLRKRLLETCSSVDIVDLDGNSRQRDLTATTVDENVFNIQQGVAIATLVRESDPTTASAIVRSCRVRGSRTEKFALLRGATFPVKTVNPEPPNYLFGDTDSGESDEWGSFTPLSKLMGRYGDPAPGFVTTHDEFAISWSEDEAIGKVAALLKTRTEAEARQLFQLCTTDQWSYSAAVGALSRSKSWRSSVVRVLYRPFDWRFTIWNEHVNVHRRERAQAHMIRGANLALVTVRQVTKGDFAHALVSNSPTELKLASHDRNSQAFPLWLYDEAGGGRVWNFDPDAVRSLGVAVTTEEDALRLFHVVYAILHSPGYRKRYSSRLRAEFPSLPPMTNVGLIKQLEPLGADLVATHLLAPEYPGASWNLGARRGKAPWKGVKLHSGVGNLSLEPGFPKHRENRLLINESAWVEPVSVDAWEFGIGGYPVLRKWLKSRSERQLSKEDADLLCDVAGSIAHTLILMERVESAIADSGGWPDAFVTKPAGAKK